MARQGAVKPISLALQGGGAHGAFTWGVVDRLLEEEGFSIAGISGTSAGAMNAVVMASGLARGGPNEARAALANFWRDVSRDGRLSPLQRTAFDRIMGNWSLAKKPGLSGLRGGEPLPLALRLQPDQHQSAAEIVEAHADFEAIRASDVKVFHLRHQRPYRARAHFRP